ncbi:Protein CBG25290 [Caenorhabditis briggsae]|uniref:Protein CBG25290 n=1 Tax=Caenorhabditis briggsae TaxID=6238 RepID=B6ILS5_CAEBR|nr:Protein CBG25290 [Caenorhabditis briggsae]CAS00855.1 Protein CBG25290 [Caenorhabditis briggsae]
MTRFGCKHKKTYDVYFSLIFLYFSLFLSIHPFCPQLSRKLFYFEIHKNLELFFLILKSCF